MDLTRTGLSVVVVALYTVGCVFCQVTQNRDIDNIAQNLQVKVILTTNHNISGNHAVQIVFNNTGSQRILHTKQWAVKFEVNSELFQAGATSYTAQDLQVKHDKGCSYAILPTAQFTGLNQNQYVAFTIPGRGLMMFRTDVYPNFIATKQDGSYARTIQSTSSDDLNFVYINSANTTGRDPSVKTGIMRSVSTPDAPDEGGVSSQTIIPPGRQTTIDSENIQIIRLNDSAPWVIWANPNISSKIITRLTNLLTSLPNMAGQVSIFSPTPANPRPAANASVIFVFIPTNKNDVSPDYYRLAVGNNQGADFIHITAIADQGFSNAIASMKSILGLFVVMPHIQIEDDARFGIRSVKLDVTKNFFNQTTVVKFLKLMSRYKLNNLVLVLADDYGWRLQMPTSMDFAELTTFASKRCADDNTCLHPDFGAGATPTTSASGFYSMDEFVDIIKEARDLSITVTPMFNFMGSMYAAKQASHKRFQRLKDTNITSANRLHLMTPNYPTLTLSHRPEDSCYIDGLLDPCDDATTNFINEVYDAVNFIYHTNGVQLPDFHAGGDGMTKYLNNFTNCNNPQRKILSALRQRLPPTVKVRVNEEAVRDYSAGTRTCLTASGNYNPSDVYVDFWDISPDDHRNWGLNVGQWAYLNDPISESVNDTGTDPLKPYTYANLGDAPWSMPYKCANMDYKIILGPRSFFGLDAPHEIDFYEIGNRRKNAVNEINLYNMNFEPFNIDGVMTVGPDFFRFPPYRLCRMFNCVQLQQNKRRNIVGLQASIDTAVIRNEATLWHMVVLRLLMFAERAWREGPHEGLLDPRDTQALINNTLVRYRAAALEAEMAAFLNTLGYKEAGILDNEGYSYRIPRPGATIYNGVPFRMPGPMPSVIKVLIPGQTVEYLKENEPNPVWRTMFEIDPNTGALTGGHAFRVPFLGIDNIQVRVRSANGMRYSIPTRLGANAANMFPRDIPPDVRNGTCLPIFNYTMTQIEDITPAQWTRIIQNIYALSQDDMIFMRQRNTQLENAFRGYQATNTDTTTRGLTMAQVFQTIEYQLASGVDMSTRTNNDIFQHMFNADRNIMTARQTALRQRLDILERQYQMCSASGSSSNSAAG